MSFRAIASLLTRATPKMAPARSSLHSLRDLTLGGFIDGAAVFAAAALAGAGGTLASHYFRKGSQDDESAARKEEEDVKARFEDWTKKKNKTYRDEEEKAMQFQLFKATVDCRFLPLEEAFPHGIDWSRRLKHEKGEPLVRKPTEKQGDTRGATQAPA